MDSDQCFCLGESGESDHNTKGSINRISWVLGEGTLGLILAPTQRGRVGGEASESEHREGRDLRLIKHMPHFV